MAIIEGVQLGPVGPVIGIHSVLVVLSRFTSSFGVASQSLTSSRSDISPKDPEEGILSLKGVHIVYPSRKGGRSSRYLRKVMALAFLPRVFQFTDLRRTCERLPLGSMRPHSIISVRT